MVVIHGQVTFTSKKLMEIQVVVDVDNTGNQQIQSKRIAAGYLCFICTNQLGKTVNIPGLKVCP